MNIYEKLSETRVELQEMKLKKSGKNTYAGFTYFELGDFLPAINVLCKKHGLMTAFSILPKIEGEEEMAQLEVINVDEPSEIIKFTSSTATPQIGKKADGTGGADPIQNLGGKITYMRRYMLMTAFEMVESDLVEQIKKQTAEEIDEKDMVLLENAKSHKELVDVYQKLKNQYRKEVLAPVFQRRKAELKQDTEENQDKEDK